MRKTFLLIGLLLADNIVFAQSIYTDSLKIELNKAKDDTSRVLILADLAYYHRFQNLDTAIVYSQQSLSLAKNINFLRGQSIAYQMMCVIYRYLGNFPIALEKGYQGLQISDNNNFINEKALSLMRIGTVFQALGDNPKAISFYHSSMQILGHEKLVRANALNWVNIGSTYLLQDQIDSAWFYNKKAYDNLNLIKDLRSDVCRNLGTNFVKKGDKVSALQFYNEGLDAASKSKDNYVASSIYAEKAKMYYKEKNADSSFYYAKKGLEAAQIAKNPRIVLSCGNLLAEILETSNPAEALRYYKIASAAKEGLFGTGNLQAIQALVVKEEERKNEIELAEIDYRSKMKQYGLLTGLSVILIVAFILYRNNKQKQKANTVLESTLSNLKSTQSQLIQSEKMASLGEPTAGIAHEIQNPLNFVNNFSEVSTELVDEMNEEIKKGNLEDATSIAADLKQNLEKINHHGKRAGDIVKGMLQHSRSSSGQKELTDINALADEYLRLAYHGLRAKDKSFNATMKTEFDESIGKINIIPQDIGRVVLNLINNAFYAVTPRPSRQDGTGSKGGEGKPSENREPTVWVSTKKLNGKVEIKVSDNGNGIPQKILDKIFQPFFTTKPTGQGTGLGLSLSYDIVKAHGGELKVETKEGEGSEFVILLPVS